MTAETKLSPLQAQLAPIEAFLAELQPENGDRVYVGLGTSGANLTFFQHSERLRAALVERLGPPKELSRNCDVKWPKADTGLDFEVAAYNWPSSELPQCRTCGR